MSSPNTEVLIVDDSPTIRAAIGKHLGDEYTTHFATDGEEGWALLQSNASIALVFADMHMPVMNGMLLLQKIRESDCERISNIPVIMITGHEDSDAAKKATHNIGATDFVSKPFDKIDILSRARSYTSLSKQISQLEKKAAYDTLTGLYSNRMLLEFGNKTLSFEKRHNMATSILYAEVADTQKLIETYGSKATNTIITTVAGLLESSVRKEELVAHIEDGKFAIVLPNTKSFKAHIVATRLKQSAEDLVFDISKIKIHVSLAVGLCSTEFEDSSAKLDFEEYCVQAARALATSLDTSNKRIIRYDETYEKKLDDDKGAYTFSTPSTVTPVESDEASIDAFGDFFSDILSGDYSNIPTEFLPTLIEPLENFLQYAHSALQDVKKVSGE
ncbi:MAG: response regulator [Gammaproteobacteria bacterium]|jgi:diguanylate cyclase (GGDEF)-like protein